MTHEKVKFDVAADQTSIIRDGRPAVVSRKKNTVVLISPSTRGFSPGSRPVYIVGATNISSAPLDLMVKNISVMQYANGSPSLEIPIVTYDQLVSEEKTRQAIGAIVAGLAAGANSYNASRAGYGNMSGTVYGRYGTAHVSARYYDPAAAAIATQNANIQNSQLINQVVDNGRRNMAALERDVLKDNTIMPGEWIGGQLHLSPLSDAGGEKKEYIVTINIGNDVHEIKISQEPSK